MGGAVCGDLARDTPPLPRHSPIRWGQGRSSPRHGPDGPWTYRPGVGPQKGRRGARPKREASGVAGPPEAGWLGGQLSLGNSVFPHPQSNEADNTGSRENWRGNRSRGLHSARCQTASTSRPGGRAPAAGAALGPSLTSDCCSGTHSPPGPSYHSRRPSLNRPHFRWPAPRKRSSAAAHRAAPASTLEGPPGSGRGERRFCVGGRRALHGPPEGTRPSPEATPAPVGAPGRLRLGIPEA